MGAKEILDNVGVLVLTVIFGSGLIQIAPIKINPWSWLIQRVGREAGKELYEKSHCRVISSGICKPNYLD